MARLAKRIARLREELARQEVIEIVAPAWASRPISQPAPPAEAAPAAAQSSSNVIDTAKARRLSTPRRRRQRR